jgi:hypothetical protein
MRGGLTDWAGKGAVAALALAGIVGSTAYSMGQVFARSKWETALAWWPIAPAQSRAAGALEEAEPTPQTTAAAAAYAQAALARAPLHAPGARVLGALAQREGRAPQAAALYGYSYSVSRRDVPTYVHLIREAAERRDVDRLVALYERVLTTSNRSSGLLVPLLVQMTRDPQVAAPLAAKLARRPHWWRGVAEGVARQGPSAEAIMRILSAVRLRPTDEGERQILVAGIVRLIQLGEPRQALALYSAGTGRDPRQLLRHGDFEADSLLPPLDWQLTDSPDLAAYPEQRGNGRALHFVVRNAQSGLLAGQVLMLPPGSYRLTYRVGGTPAGSAQIALAIACRDGRNETRLLETSFPAQTSEAGAQASAQFSVGQGCGSQWLAIAAPPGLPAIDGTTWLDDVTIQAIR